MESLLPRCSWEKRAPSYITPLLKDLIESLEPQGTLELLLVEKLVTTTWRYRRLLLAESAAIHKNIDELTTERLGREDSVFDLRVARDKSLAQTDREGLLAKIAEPGVLEDCLERLYQLRKLMEKNGRSEEHTSELQSRLHLVCRLLLEKKKKTDMYDDVATV